MLTQAVIYQMLARAPRIEVPEGSWTDHCLEVIGAGALALVGFFGPYASLKINDDAVLYYQDTGDVTFKGNFTQDIHGKMGAVVLNKKI
jgi:hypothetical protein